MGTIRKIDPDALERMWLGGVPSGEIAERFGVLVSTVSNVAKEMNLPARDRMGRLRVPVSDRPARAEALRPVDRATDLDAAIREARGYRDLQRIADRFGKPMTLVLSRWHRRAA